MRDLKKLSGIVTAVGMLIAAQSAAAAVIAPDTLTDEYNSDPMTCSLREAVQSANTDTAFNGCTPGSGADEIDLGDGTYQLSRPEATSTNADGELDIVGGSTVTISHSGSGRTAIDGGDLDRVIYNLGTLTISGLAVQNGRVTSQNAGGIANEGDLTLTNATVNDNEILTAGYGGGIWSFSGSLVLTNVTIEGNRVPSGTPGAGGIYASVLASLTNVTVTNNDAGTSLGGGIRIAGSTTVNLKNTIIAGNVGGASPDCFNMGTLSSLGHNLIGDNSNCPFTLGTGDQINVPAGLSALSDNGGPTSTSALMPGSNALDKVPPADCGGLTTDQRGYPRPSATNANCDIGAYELTACGGNALNAPGAFPGCPVIPPVSSPSPSLGPTTSPGPTATPAKKKCKKAKKRATTSKQCKKKRK